MSPVPEVGSMAEIRAGAASLAEILGRRARRQPQRPAFSFLADGETESESLSFGELDRRARALGFALAQSTPPGERALLLYPPSLDFVVAFFGCLYAGLVAVPCYPPRARRPQERVLSIARDAEPAVVMCPASLSNRGDLLVERVPGLSVARWLETEGLASSTPRIEGEALVEPGESWHPPAVTTDDLAMLQYTSGSTAEPKGVMVRHGDLLHNQETIRRAFRQDEASVVVSWLPLYHDMGLIGGVLQPLYSGGRCVLMSSVSFLQRPRRWLEAVSRHRATTSGAPNFAYDLVVAKSGDDLEGLDLSSWRVAFNGAEPVRAATLESFATTFAAAGFDDSALYPCYGLAEATLFVTGGGVDTVPRLRPVATAELEAGRGTAAAAAGLASRTLVSCGAAVRDLEVRIVDPETRRPTAAGEVGEIWLRGEAITAGYWRQPEATAEVFGARLAGGDAEGDDGDGDRRGGDFLRTGDLGFVAEGELFVTGRRKELLILRGRNHYPQDLERTAEAAHPALQPGGSAAFSVTLEAGEAAVLVAEVSRHHDGDHEALARAVRAAVAETHGVGLHDILFLQQATLPRTTSGKKRRSACRQAYLAGGGDLRVVARSTAAVGPGDADLAAAGELDRHTLAALDPASRQGALAALIAELAARAADAPAVPATDLPLSGLGLDSLAVIELQRLLAAELAVDVPLESLLAGPSAKALAAELAPAFESSSPVPVEASGFHPSAGEANEPFSLTPGQEALWFLHRLAPDSGAYNLAAAARLQGGVDAEALAAAVAGLARHHPALAARFVTRGGEIHQVHDPAAGLTLERQRRQGRPLDAVLDELRAEAFRPFALGADGPARFILYERGDEDPLLLAVVHHLVADFASLEIVARDLGLLYAGMTPPTRPAVGYRDFAAWLHQRIARNADADWEYWRRRLDGAPSGLDLPTDRPRTGQAARRGGSRSVRLPVATALNAVAGRLEATPFAVLLAAFQSVLARHSHSRDLLVGSPLSLRDVPEVEELVGYLVNPLPLRADLSAVVSFADLVLSNRETVNGALAHRDLPLPWLAERLSAARGEDGARRGTESSLFQVLHAHQRRRRGGDASLAAFALGLGGVELHLGRGDRGLTVESVELEQGGAAFAMSLMTSELGGAGEGDIGATLTFDADLFDGATAERLLGHLGVLLEAALALPDAPLTELPLLTDAEARQLLGGWAQGGELPTAPGATLHAAFEAAARRWGEAVALTVGEESLTYGELEHRAETLATRLRRAGVGSETRVGVLLPRRVDLVVSLLAVLKAGGAYVPLDSAYPVERLRFMLEDSAAAVLLTDGDGGDSLAHDLALRVLHPTRTADHEAEATVTTEARVGNDSAPLPDNLAYVIYTSGSTGRPKGVAISHRNAAAMVAWARQAFPEPDLAGVLAATSVCFDLSVFELFVPLAVGGAVILADDALALPRLPARDRVTLVNTVPSALAELLRGSGLPASVRTVNLAGEALPGALARAVHDAGEARLYNLYGPSEDTTYSTWGEVRRGNPGEPTIGRPVVGTRAYVLDRRGRVLPAGVPGELFLGGAGVSRGYLGRSALTADRYLPDPFAGAAESGSRLYRTGDRVRWRADGELEFLGRLDHQVKVRGFRIELGEVEAVLADHPRVAEVVAVATSGPGGVPRLVAYLAGDGLPEAAELRRHAAGRLPEHALPSLFVHLEALPRTPNGKVDRRALPAPDLTGQVVADETPPRTPVEEVLVGIWGDLFDLPAVGVHTSFFDLGGHSLLATRILARMRDALGVELPMTAVFDTPTIASLAARMEAERRAGDEADEDAAPVPPLTATPMAGAPPLSFAQERLWFLDQLEPGLSVYNVPGALRWRDPLEVGALRSALHEVVRRHETLRTSLVTVEERPLQRVVSMATWSLPRVDLRRLGLQAAEAEAHRIARAEARQPFDLAVGPLLRTRVLHLGEEDHLVLATLHHIASDGWSLGILAREVGVLYAAFRAGRPSPLPDLPVRYADFALWQRRWLSGVVLDRQLAYWRQALADAPPILDLPTDRPRPALQSFRGDSVPVRLSPGLTSGLRSLARRHGATLFMTLLAAFKVLVARHSGQTDLVLGTPLANRGRAEIEGLIGFFVNTLVVRTRLGDDPDFATLLGRVRESVLDVHAHQDLPLEKLVEELQLDRDLSRAPLFQVVFALQTEAQAPLDLPSVALDFQHVSTGTSKFDVMLDIGERGDRVEGYLEFASDLFDRATMSRMAHQYGTLLRALVAAEGAGRPALPVSRLPLLTAGERHHLLVEANAVPVPTTLLEAATGTPALVHQRFAAAARHAPEATAVVAADGSLTYGELASAAHQVAHHLVGLGAGPEDVVAVCLPRGKYLAVAMLASLAAGAAYLPLDPGYPADRLAYMLADSGARALVTDASGAAALADGALPVVRLDEGADRFASQPGEAPAVAVEGGHLAYLIYTSGSTGRPKGVAVEHRQIASYVDAAVDRLGLRSAASYATVSTFAADLGHTCVFPALTRGATLHLVDEETAADPEAMGAYVEAHGVGVIKLVPSHLEALLGGEHPRRVLPRHSLILGGEAWGPRLASRLAALDPSCAVHNHYGPSETTVGVFARRVNLASVAGSPDLGRPLARRTAYLLARGMEPVPPGAWGELHLGGDGVARGYVGRPRFTAERFLPDSFGDEPGSRLYRTGDLARALHGGEVRFVGRADDQVKYHGYRIEPNEIRLALNAHPKVRDSLVLLRHDAAGRDALVAYYVCRAELDPEELRGFLAASLIEETVPNVFVHLRKLPLNLNGKVNREALPSLDDLRQRTRVEHLAPRTPTEETLAEIWREVLGAESPSVHDNFFQLGGHSLLATRVISRIRRSFAVDLPLRVLFERPTIARLAVAVTEAELAQEDGDEMARMMEELAGMSGEELEKALREEAGTGVDREREPV